MKQQDVDQVRGLVQALCGARVWRCGIKVNQSFEETSEAGEIYSPTFLTGITFALRRPAESEGEHTHAGEISIDCEGGEVRFEEAGRVMLGGRDAVDRWRSSMPVFLEASLVEVLIEAPGGDTCFVFDVGRVIRVFPVRTAPGVAWTVTTADETEIRVGAGGVEIRRADI